MTETSQTIAEIVTFRLVEGADPSAFVRAARALEPLLAATGQVKARTLTQDAAGLWTDHIIWCSLAAAHETAAQMMTDPRAAPMLSMIDPAQMQMRHAPVYYEQGEHAQD